MRVLFSSTPQHGHLLPELPLARAFRDRGDEVAFLTSAGFASLFADEGFTHLPVGPEIDVLLAEAARLAGVSDPTQPSPAAAAELFASARINTTGDEAVAAARAFGPDLVVVEGTDYVGPLVAAVLDVPYAKLALGPAIPVEFTSVFDDVAELRYKERGLTVPAPTWNLDPCPALLQAPGWEPPPGHLPIRAEAHRGAGAPKAATFVPTGDRPRVLVSFGTHFTEPAVLRPLVAALSAHADLVVAVGLTATAADYEDVSGGVEIVGFTPLADLLGGIDLVVTHGGAGTTMGTLSRGVPLVVVPQGADQFVQAGAVAASRTGVAVMPPAAPEAVAEAVREALGNPEYRDNARRAAGQVAAAPSPGEIAERLAAAIG
ncbi:glycosyltransferase [Streptomyces sp. SID11385]|uniref:glycosyltransferase n=1 Tax=Streptomyces sp. SID11385 TaxID=2706031 RepID=UPI0013C6BBBC|nr:glycosyltransferase [Streptomyces sp. SID11385]NEA39849.1 glycosyltransferase family 1 protein [Streptomyces sp. SID11385]